MSSDGPASIAEESRRLAASSVRAHGVSNLALAALYSVVGFVVAPSRQPWFPVALAVVVALVAVAGVALLLRLRRARLIAMVAQAILLAFAATTLWLLVASAAYLRGIYGAVGQGMAALTLVVAALVIELCGLLPLLQLRMLLRPDVRRLLDEPPAAAAYARAEEAPPRPASGDVR